MTNNNATIFPEAQPGEVEEHFEGSLDECREYLMSRGLECGTPRGWEGPGSRGAVYHEGQGRFSAVVWGSLPPTASAAQILYDGPRISKAAAKSQAHRESHMYRQGSGHIVSTWDDGYGCNVTSNELPYHVARRAVAEYRRNRVAQLLGLEVA
jgi:hypothetical protein